MPLSAVALGGAAFLADAVPGLAGRIVVTLTSSGLASGVAALLIALRRRDRRSALTMPTYLLLGATRRRPARLAAQLRRPPAERPARRPDLRPVLGRRPALLFRAWRSLDAGRLAYLTPALLTIGLAALTTVYATRRRPPAVVLLLTSATLSALVGTALWWSVEQIRLIAWI